ncbi:hypothetical protein LCGC14_0964340, partial [marine sediment metagenome]
MPKTLSPNTPWQRLLALVTSGLGDKDDGFNFATGLHLGLVIAISHPEYAVAMHQAIEGDDMLEGHQNSERLADHVV